MSFFRPVIIGCRTENFTDEQLEVFSELKPLGMIVFSEPCEYGKDAVNHVVKQFINAVGNQNAPILIDNEGGRVNRFNPEYGFAWREVPSPELFANIAKQDLNKAKEAVFLNAQLIAYDMREVGVNVNCAPVVDVLTDDTFVGQEKRNGLHATSGDMKSRMFGNNVDVVTALGRAYCKGLMHQGVVPIIKHIPGYGRVIADPHYTITRVDHSLEELEKQDFVPFKQLSDMPCAMTGHVLYSAIDSEYSSTISPKVLKVIRENIGFRNLIITDAIEMNSIAPELFDERKQDKFGMNLPKKGTIAKITKASIDAGCDLVLHCDCSRDFSHTVEALEAVAPMEEQQFKRVSGLLTVPDIQEFDKELAIKKLNRIIELNNI